MGKSNTLFVGFLDISLTGRTFLLVRCRSVHKGKQEERFGRRWLAGPPSDASFALREGDLRKGADSMLVFATERFPGKDRP